MKSYEGMDHRLKQHIALLSIFFLFPFSCIGQENAIDKVKNTISQRISNGEMVGIVIGFVDSSGTNFITQGTVERNSSRPVDEKTVFEIGSITKLFTALLLSEEIQNGALSLDTPIEKLLPENVSVPSYTGKNITLEHLATHTSGLPRLPDNMSPTNPLNPYQNYHASNLYSFLNNYELTRAPGTKFEYSNLGVGLLGHLLELHSGIDYETLVNKKITGMLNMPSTNHTMSSSDSLYFAQGHTIDGKVPNWQFSVLAGAGSLHSNAIDLAKFLEAQLGFIASSLHQSMKKTVRPQFNVNKSNIDKVGLGWFHTLDNDHLTWHTGGTGGFRSFIGFNNNSNSGIIILSNSSWEVSDIGFFLLDQRYNLNTAVETEIKSISNRSLDKYTGIYKAKDSDITFFVTKQDTQLWIRLKGQNNFRVYPKSEKRFYYKVVNAEIEFDIIPDTDSVRGLTLYQNGAQIFAQKVKKNDKSIQKEREKTIINPAILKRYVGKYQIAPSFVIEVTINDKDQLFIQATGQPKLPIFPESETEFFLKKVDAQIEFINIENRDQSNSIKLYQNGQIFNGKRIFKN